MGKMYKYNKIKIYKRVKNKYKEFIVFVKGGKYYYSYDTSARIVLYLYAKHLEKLSIKIKKEDFHEVLKKLHENGLNVILTGSNKYNEFYTDKESKYTKMNAKSKMWYRK